MKRRLLIDSEVLEVLDGISPALRNRRDDHADRHLKILEIRRADR